MPNHINCEIKRLYSNGYLNNYGLRDHLTSLLIDYQVG